MTHRDAITQAELQNTKNCFNLTVVMSVLVTAASFVFQLLLIPPVRGLRCSWEGLAVLDSMLPALLVELQSQVRVSGNAEGQAKPTTLPPPPQQRQKS